MRKESGFKGRFATPWLKGAAYSLAIGLVMFVINLLLKALGMEESKLSGSSGTLAAAFLLIFLPWLSGILLSLVDKKINIK